MQNYDETAKKVLQKLSDDHKISSQMKENLLKEFRESLQNVKKNHRLSMHFDYNDTKKWIFHYCFIYSS